MQPFKLLFLAGLLTVSVASVAQGNDNQRPDHFKGQPSANLDQALSNLAEYNAKLEAVTSKAQLAPADMAEIHQLTYTLEVALEKLDDEIDRLKEQLEEVHKGSEMMEFDRVRDNAQRYLTTSKKLIKP